MERTVKIILTESDARLLMQICSMLPYDTLYGIIAGVETSYDEMEEHQTFRDIYGDFDPRYASAFTGYLYESLEEALVPPDEIVLNLLDSERFKKGAHE